MVDWVVNQTKSEASERWARQKRVDWFILAERVGGLLCGFSIALIGLGLAAYLALHDREITAGIIAGGTLVGIVAVLVQGRKISAPEQSGVKPSDKKR